ncbi:MAG: response regulator transcription factor [Planctomycetia bacterium]|nr:response regulator transcription factor [Planctomycetia bacterium]
MSRQECVLVVDEVSDTAEVLQAVLEPRGVAVSRVRRLDGPSGPVNRPPSVMVLDADAFGAAPTCGEGWRNVPQVIIGTVRSPDSEPPDGKGSRTARRYLQKPFQFAELVQAIESLIAPK